MSESENSGEQTRVGDVLKKAREAMGLSINDVSVSTKINSRVLSALEEGQLDDLPPKTFTRGFIRSYAQYLKIDPQPIIDAYNMDDPFISNMGKTQDAPESSTPKTEPSTRTNLDSSSIGPKIFLAAGIAVLIVLIIGIKKVVDRYSQESITPDVVKTESGSPILTNTEEDEPESTEDGDATAAAETQDSEAAAPSETAPANPTAAATTTAPATTPVTTSPTTSTVATTPTPPVAAKPIETKPAETKPAEVKPAETKPAEPKPTEAKPAEPKKPEPAKAQTSGSPQEVILEALDNVEVTFKVDNESSKKISLKPESIYTIKAQESVQIEISDGGLVNVIQNGRSKGSAGDLGKSAKLKFP